MDKIYQDIHTNKWEFVPKWYKPIYKLGKQKFIPTGEYRAVKYKEYFLSLFNQGVILADGDFDQSYETCSTKWVILKPIKYWWEKFI
jgi:hypothetical protein